MRLNVLLSYFAILFLQFVYAKEYFSNRRSNEKSSSLSLFASLPFLPKPQFKPERYDRSPRIQRAPMMKSHSSMASVLKSFNGLSFNKVYYPMPDPNKGPVEGPFVIPLLYGNYTECSECYTFTSTVALVLDERANSRERCYILVDTGLSIFKNTIIGGLAAHGVRLQDVQSLILTHSDVDSMGNLNLFPDAEIFVGNKKANRQFFIVQKTAPSFDNRRSGLPYRPLCDHTDIFLTPGFTSHDLSLVVRDVQGYGTIAIVGNLIMNEQDVADKGRKVMKEFSLDEEQEKLWEATRNEIICMADYVVPGHGPTFKVKEEYKSAAKCKN